jgi:hypothetical protein
MFDAELPCRSRTPRLGGSGASAPVRQDADPMQIRRDHAATGHKVGTGEFADAGRLVFVAGHTRR